MTTREPEPRVSVTSVPERWRELYLAIFSVQTLALLGLAIWYEIFVVTDDTWPETIFAIARNVGPGVAAIMAESIIVTEGLFMVLFGGILRRREERRVEEAETRGRSQGRAEGLAQANENWEEWNQRRLEAEAEGRPFTEPPPSARQSENKAEGE